MNLTRRNFVCSAALAAVSGSLLNNLSLKAKDASPIKNAAPSFFNKLLLPSAISEGSLIAITAPASHTSMGEVSHGIKFFHSMGCEVEVGETIKNRKLNDKYLSADDEYRATEFMEFIERDDINLIITLKKEGKTNIEIRKITSINEDKILKICKSNDLKLYTHYLLPTENDLLILQKKYEELKNIKKVHESFGGKYSHSFLRKNIKKTKRIKSEIERKEKKML